MPTAVLLIAHGSRLARANQDLFDLAATLNAEGQYLHVAASFLEIAQPTIPEGARACVQAGATQVLMMPYFLSAGSHVTMDLERHRVELSELHPGVSFELREQLGRHPLMLEIVKSRLAGE